MDQDTFSVYGHVMGSDRMGHALVTPLWDTIQQIKIAFNANTARLPQDAKRVSAVDPEIRDGQQGRHQTPHGYALRQEAPVQPISEPIDMPNLLDTSLSTNPHAETPSRTDSPSSNLEHTRREGPTPNSCIDCHNGFQTTSQLEHHAVTAGHYAFSCMCGWSTSKSYALVRHINSYSESTNSMLCFQCYLCDDMPVARHHKLIDKLKDRLRHHFHKASYEIRTDQLYSRLELSEPPMTEAICTGLSVPQLCPSQSVGDPAVAFPWFNSTHIFPRPPSSFLTQDTPDGADNRQSFQNLVDFWDTTKPPTTATESLMLWKSLSKLAGALHMTHHTCSDGSPR